MNPADCLRRIDALTDERRLRVLQILAVHRADLMTVALDEEYGPNGHEPPLAPLAPPVSIANVQPPALTPWQPSATGPQPVVGHHAEPETTAGQDKAAHEGHEVLT